MITHTADFFGVAQKFDLSKEWSLRVNLEFQAQVNQTEAIASFLN